MQPQSGARSAQIKGQAMTLTDEQLAGIRGRLELARLSGMVFVKWGLAPDDPRQQAMVDFTNFQAYAPTDIRALLTEVRRLQEIESEYAALVDIG